MDYKSSVYYTLSTIPQVLAAFIALSSVFVIFKMQEFNKLLLFYLNIFWNKACEIPGAYPTLMHNLEQLQKSESTSEITEEMENFLNNNSAANPATIESLKNIFSPAKKLHNNRSAIMLLTYISIPIGVLTIIYSIIILSVAHSISENNFICIIRLGIIGAIISIVTMTLAIILCLKEGRVIKK
jgi:hypothetical protein